MKVGPAQALVVARAAQRPSRAIGGKAGDGVEAPRVLKPGLQAEQQPVAVDERIAAGVQVGRQPGRRGATVASLNVTGLTAHAKRGACPCCSRRTVSA